MGIEDWRIRRLEDQLFKVSAYLIANPLIL